jgi:hypothetical protein
MPPESVRMLASALPARPANSSSSPIFGRIAASLHAEVAAIHDQVLGGGEIGVEVVELRHHADLHARLAGPRRHRFADQRDLPESGAVRPRQQRSVVVLPAPLGPSRP